jgi:hypothetical protein
LDTANAFETPEFIAGLIFYAYPLHPPGDKRKLRDVPVINSKHPMQFISGTNDAFCDLDLLKKTIAKMKHKDEVPPTLELIDGGDHSYKAKGGKAVYTANLNKVTKASLQWAQKQFGSSSAVAATPSNDEDEESDSDEVVLMNTKKRKAPSATDKKAGTAASKKTKTIESAAKKGK